MSFEYKHLALGGTFDYLHKGHRAFLDFAHSSAEKVSVGITSDLMMQDKEKNGAQTLKTRLNNLQKFLQSRNFLNRTKIIIINDVFGTAVSDKTIDGLIITKATKNGARIINKKRKELGLKPLPLIIFPMVLADDKKPISSTRIRLGEITKEGLNYKKYLLKYRRFDLPAQLRPKLHEPFGVLYKNIDQAKILLKNTKRRLLITVGDKTTNIFIANKIIPNLAIIDFKVERKKVYSSFSDLGFIMPYKWIGIRNHAGTITRKLNIEISRFFAKKITIPFIIKITGEEDLAVLPAVILAPLNSIVAYGQKDQGLVLIKITEKKKAQALIILKQFKFKYN